MEKESRSGEWLNAAWKGSWDQQKGWLWVCGGWGGAWDAAVYFKAWGGNIAQWLRVGVWDSAFHSAHGYLLCMWL